MPPPREYVHTPVESRRRGLAAIGFRFQTADGLRLIPFDPSGPRRGTLLGGEERTGERLLGGFEIGVFSAALLIDRDGILEQMASEEAERVLAPPAAGELLAIHPFAVEGHYEGYRADLVLADDGGGARPACPYVSLLALAPPDLGVAGGLFVTVRSAAPEWPAAALLLDSLQILAPGGARGAGDDAGGMGLPMVKLR